MEQIKSINGKLLSLIYSRKQFIKYCIVGATAAVVDFSALYIFTEFFGIYYLISNFFAFVFSASTNFLLNKFWTFRNRSSAYLRQFTKFLIVVIIGLGISTLLMYFFTEKFGLWYMLSKAITIGLVLFWNYTGNKHLTFKH
jgi:putative flippase GtrA